jgi:hypothetical protein
MADIYTSPNTRNVIYKEVLEHTSTSKLCNSSILNKNLDAGEQAIRIKPDRGNWIKNLSNNPNKSQAAVASNSTSSKKT